jgi:LysM repeat protein
MTSMMISSRTTTARPVSSRSKPTRPAGSWSPRPGSPTLSETGSVVRLTRRGRLVVVFGVLMIAAGSVAVGGGPAASTNVVHHPRTTTVVVSPGETLWDIAQQVAPQTDPRTTVAEIEQLNSLSDAGSILVGQPLTVPVG